MPRKKAFVVGLNHYSNPKYELSGCINDIDSLTDVLINQFSFPAANFTRLTDSGATKTGILQGLSALLAGASSGDVLVFGYSGHGCRKPAAVPGTQPDDMSDAIVPYEARYDSLIADYELFELIISKVTSPDIKFTAIYDCCHSGTMIRDITFDPVNGSLVTAIENRCIFLPELQGVSLRSVNVGPYSTFSACGDSETAADVRKVPGETGARGAFSYALHKLLRANAGMTPREIDTQIKPLIKGISSHVQNPEFHTPTPDGGVFS
jgi:hypothetical protein